MSKLFCLFAIALIAVFAAAPMHAQSGLTVDGFVENQVCLSKDFVQVTFTATAVSNTQPVGFRWDLNNDGKPDTAISTSPEATQIYGDETSVTAKVVALNKAGERAQDRVTFTTMKCR